MKSVHERLDPVKEEVLAAVENYGAFRAMTQFEVRDYACFKRWLKEVTGDENFGLHPKLSLNGHQSLGDQLVNAFLYKVAQLQAENVSLHKEIERLKEMLSGEHEKEQTQALAIMETCRA